MLDLERLYAGVAPRLAFVRVAVEGLAGAMFKSDN